MKKETIWISGAMNDSSLMKQITSDLFTDDPMMLVDTIKSNDRGVPLSADRFPSELYARYPDQHFKKLPDICSAGGFWIVSAECAAVLRQFDLGQTSLYPTKVLQSNRKTPVEGEYLCINFGEVKSAFDPDESPQAHPFPGNLWTFPYGVADGEVAVTRSALGGPDLWIDTRMRKAFFLSDRVAQALKAAKLTRRFKLRKCRLL